jgi:hypothetical protein
MNIFGNRLFIRKSNELEISIFCTDSNIWNWIENTVNNNFNFKLINSNTFRFENENELSKFLTIFNLKWGHKLTG